MIVEYKPEHFLNMNITASQHEMVPYQDEFYAKHMGESPYMFSYMKDKMILAVGGISHRAAKRGEAFLIADEKIGKKDYIFIRNFTRELIEKSMYSRIEATIEKDDKRGQKWLKSMDFEYEGTLRKYGLNGEDHEIYARIK